MLPVSELIEQCNVQSLIGSRCKALDHSILSLSFTISYLPNVTKDGCADRNDKNESMRARKSNTIPNGPRYRLSNFPKNFQENNIWRNALKEIVHGIEQCKTIHYIQSDIDNVHDKLCITIENEMKMYLKPIRSVSDRTW